MEKLHLLVDVASPMLGWEMLNRRKNGEKTTTASLDQSSDKSNKHFSKTGNIREAKHFLAPSISPLFIQQETFWLRHSFPLLKKKSIPSHFFTDKLSHRLKSIFLLHQYFQFQRFFQKEILEYHPA